MSLPLGRLAKFGGLQILNAVVPILILPGVIAAVGVSGWVGFAIGFSLGAAVAVAVNFAWPVLGPARVAGRTPRDATDVYVDALGMRLTVFVPAVAVGWLMAWWLTPHGHLTLSLAMTTAIAVNGLAPNWFFIGRGTAGGIVKYESIPKLVATSAAIPLVHLTNSAMVYPMLLIVAAAGGIAAANLHITGSVIPRTHALRDLSRMRAQLPIASAGVASSGATALAVPIATLSGASVAVIAVFAAGTRLRSMAQAGIGAGTSGLQGWVSENRSGTLDRKRARVALTANTAIGAVAAVGVTVVTPLADSLIFGPDIKLSVTFSALLGAVCLCYAISASLTNHILAPSGLAHVVVRSTMIASLLAVPAIFALTATWGANGAMVAVLGAEGLVVLLQASPARRVLAG